MDALLDQLTMAALGAGVLGLVIAAYFYYRVKALPEGTDTLNLIARYIREGAMAFLTRDLSFSLVRFRLGAALARWSELPPWMQRAARAEILQLTRYGRRGMEALVDFYLAPPGPQAVELIERELAADPKRGAFVIKRLNRRRSS